MMFCPKSQLRHIQVPMIEENKFTTMSNFALFDAFRCSPFVKCIYPSDGQSDLTPF